MVLYRAYTWPSNKYPIKENPKSMNPNIKTKKKMSVLAEFKISTIEDKGFVNKKN